MPRLALVGSLASALLLVAASGARADQAAPLVRVGDQAVDSHEVARAIAGCRARQPELDTAALARCLSGDAAFGWLLSRSAPAQKLAGTPSFQQHERDLLGRALLDATQAAAPLNPAALEAAEREAQRELSRPERIRIFHLLLADRPSAEQWLEKLGPHPTLAAWRAACREASLDKATNERGGDLGFVAADGSTDIPEVSCEPALFQAASTLANGELGPAPVPEANGFALIWRRGQLPAETADPARVRALAEGSARRQAGELESDKLRSQLRQQHLSDFHPERLELLRGSGRLFPAR